MKKVKFYREVSLGWPASSSWYNFLKVLHEYIARSEHMGYDDKDIMLVTEVRFEDTPSGYQVPASLIVQFQRFSERSNRHEASRAQANIVPTPHHLVHFTFNISLEMSGHTVLGFAYERVGA